MGSAAKRITKSRLAILETEEEINLVNRAIMNTPADQVEELRALSSVIDRLQEKLRRQQHTLKAWESLAGVKAKSHAQLSIPQEKTSPAPKGRGGKD